MSREQPVEPAPDNCVAFVKEGSEPGLHELVYCYAEIDALPVGTKLYAVAPIEVLVPRPEPSMSMFANKQDYETARSEWAVQRPAGDDLKDKFHSALGRYWDCAYAEGKEGRECDDFEGRAQQTLGELLDIFDTLFAETQRSPQPSRPDEKEGGPAIEDRARLLDALETIDIIWRHYVKPHTSDWRETEKAIKTVRAALGVEPRPQDRQEGTAVSSSSEPSASGGAVQRAAGEG